MSDIVNSELFDRAAEMVDYFVGKLPADVIEADMQHGDLVALHQHVLEAEALAAQEEIEAVDVA